MSLGERFVMLGLPIAVAATPALSDSAPSWAFSAFGATGGALFIVALRALRGPR